MILFLWLYFINIYWVRAVSVSKIQVMDNVVTERGTDVILVCTIQQFTLTSLISVYKTETQSIDDYNFFNRIETCVKGKCIKNGDLIDNKYRITADSSHVYIAIKDLSITQDGKWWVCASREGTSQQQMELIVYVFPSSITLSGDVTGGDLQSDSVTIQCQTNCVHPAPTSFQLFYKKTTTDWLSYKDVPAVASTSTCSDGEKNYTGTLQLPRYTVWPLQPQNTETTVKFQCRLSFPTLNSSLQSTESGNVSYAVRVTMVTLKHGDTTPNSSDIITVNEYRYEKFTCTPSISRPPATIVWYFGTRKHTRSYTWFFYIPTYTDNGKRVYCKAYNLQTEQNAVQSQQPTLNVRVRVASVTLYDGSSTPENNDEITVTQNQAKTLTCRAGDSNPPAMFAWYIGTVLKLNGTEESFTFTPTNNDHDKTVYCRAYNTEFRDAVYSTKPKLYVRVLAGIPSLTNWTSGSPEFFSGKEVTLICVSTPARPAVSVTWSKGLLPIENVQNHQTVDSSSLFVVTSTATFQTSKDDNGAMISCETSISGQQLVTVEKPISVCWPPGQPTISAVGIYPWRQDQTGKQLKCQSSDYGNPRADVVWSSIIGTVNAELLTFPKLTKSDNGRNVSCELRNTYTMRRSVTVKSQTVQLDVQYKPDVMITIEGTETYSITINEGQSLIATCSATGNPVPSVTWKGQATPFPQLTFHDIDRKDHGAYICSATAISQTYLYDFSSEKSLQVTVNYAPNVTVETDNDAAENTPLRITCFAFGRPYSTIKSIKHTWKGVTVPNPNLPEDEHISSDVETLTINNAQLQDSGTFTCLANNGIKNRTHHLDQTGIGSVLVKVAPKLFLDGKYTFAGTVGTVGNITVPFYSYPDVTSILFQHKNGTLITNSTKYGVLKRRQKITTEFYGQSVDLDGSVAALYIKDEEESDFTDYILTLINAIGTRSIILTHIGISVPSPPVSFTLLNIVKGVPTFSLVGGFNGGMLQTFIVQTAVHGTENWEEQKRFAETDTDYLKEDFLTFQFNLTGLTPNRYDVRVLSTNSIGILDEGKAINLTFAIHPTRNAKSNTGAVVGTVFGVLMILFIAIGAVLYVIRRRQLLCWKSDNQKPVQSRNNPIEGATDVSYYNVTFNQTGDQDAMTQQETTGHYEALQRNNDFGAVATYETLAVTKEVHRNKKSKGVKSGSSTNKENIYENLKLGGHSKI